ncbi:MAG: single-stranded DNA-binding protein [Kiritimatiellia bacterium]|nr:single-stranded DNA-binding protein [Lentisphaerota bacterium]
MASLNYVVLIGNLTRDPELRSTPGGVSVVDLGLAVNDTYKNKAGENVETTCFVDVVAWGRQAETCDQYLKKGSPVLVEGRLQFDQWESKDGEKRSKLRVRADRVQFLSSRRSEPAGEGSSETSDRSGPAAASGSDAPF